MNAPYNSPSQSNGERWNVQSPRRKPVAPKDEITFSEIREILVRRRWPLFLCIAAGVCVALALTVLMPTRYEAMSRLTVDFAQSQSPGVEALAQAAGVADPTKLQTQVSILETDSLAWGVIRKLRLDQKPEALPRRFGIGGVLCQAGQDQPIEDTSTECRRILLDEFHKRLHVEAVPRTEILEIRYRSRSRELAPQVVNALASLYIERNFEMKYQSAMRASGWLAGQLDQVRRDAETSELNFLKYQKQTGIVGVDGTQNLQVAQLTALNQQLVGAETERIVQEARYRTAQSGDPEALVSIAQGTTLQTLHTEQITLQNQYAQLEAKFGDAYPRVLQMKEQLAKAEAASQAELQHTREKIRNDYEAAEKNEELLRSAFEKQKEQIFNSNESGVRLALLKSDADASNELYVQIVKRVRTGNVMAGIGESEINVIDPADTPTHHAEPHGALNLLGGVLIGALCGIALCGVLEGLDIKIGTLQDVAELCPLPGVGFIPRLTEAEATGGRGKGGSTVPIAVLDSPESETADAYRSLRTALLHGNPSNRARVLLVTSPSEGEGRTMASANLAVALAQREKRVLLLDADLRQRELSCLFHADSKIGLSELLAGGDPALSFLSLAAVPGLVLLPAGKETSNPSDILDSARMREMVAAWREEFDHVIVDAPHVLGLSDSVVLSTMADSTLLVVAAGTGRKSSIARVLEVLSGVGANVSGAIVTDVAAGPKESRNVSS